MAVSFVGFHFGVWHFLASSTNGLMIEGLFHQVVMSNEIETVSSRYVIFCRGEFMSARVDLRSVVRVHLSDGNKPVIRDDRMVLVFKHNLVISDHTFTYSSQQRCISVSYYAILLETTKVISSIR